MSAHSVINHLQNGVFPAEGELINIGNGVLVKYGEKVPCDGQPGYATGCTFQKTCGPAPFLYVNEGTPCSCKFVPYGPL